MRRVRQSSAGGSLRNRGRFVPATVVLETFRYFRIEKQNNGVGGNYHKEMQLLINGELITITSAMLSQSGLNGWSPTLLVHRTGRLSAQSLMSLNLQVLDLTGKSLT